MYDIFVGEVFMFEKFEIDDLYHCYIEDIIPNIHHHNKNQNKNQANFKNHKENSIFANTNNSCK